jgi:hypothetical protein
MDPLDRPTVSPTEDTLVQSQVVLFAAALFIGCTIFDVQSARIDITGLFPRDTKAATQQVARASQPAATPVKFQARSETPSPFLKTVGLRTNGSSPRAAAACYRPNPQAAPGPLHAWHKARATVAPAASLIALVD